ncbi:hypothetical protein [Micromonospora sp. NPDC049891]|uniref:hypothetical protein n=1 Tax=Micromonospora sp. NPDC049891 TaxID=3155655 RepID=UPI0033E642F8
MADNDGTDNQGEPAGTGGKDWQAEAEKWKALARKHEDNSKTTRAELDKLKQASDTSKSDMDKVMEKLAAMEQKAADAERRALVTEVAAAKKLTPAQAKRLTGATREELEADADDLLSAFGTAGDAGSGSGGGSDDSGGNGRAGGDQGAARGRPREALRSGAAVPAGGEEETDPMKLAAKVPRL